MELRNSLIRIEKIMLRDSKYEENFTKLKKNEKQNKGTINRINKL